MAHPNRRSIASIPLHELRDIRIVPAAVALLVTGVFASPAGARQLPPPGSRIRVETVLHVPGRHWEGTIVAVRGDSMILDRDGTNGSPAGQVAVPAYTIDKLSVYAGTGHAGGTGALAVGFLGLAGGGFIGMLTKRKYACSAARLLGQRCEETSVLFNRAVVFGFGGAILGAGTGYLIGRLFSKDRWERVDIGDDIALQWDVAPGRAGIGIRLAL